MRLLAVNGSMRKNGQCARLIEHLARRLKSLSRGARVEVVHASDLSLEPCRVACGNHCIAHPFDCTIRDDLTGLIERMRRADGLILASPLYIVIPAVLNTMLERLVSLAFHAQEHGRTADNPLRTKPCGLVAVAEYTDPTHVLEHLHKVALVLQLGPVRVDGYPYLGVAGQGTLEDRGPLRPFERATELAAKLVDAVRQARGPGRTRRAKGG